MKKFISTERKGFKMTFNNGLTISVQWGTINYCDNKVFIIDPLGIDNIPEPSKIDMESNTAEVAIMIDNVIIKLSEILTKFDVEYINAPDSYIIGYCSPEAVFDIMSEVKNCPPATVAILKMRITELEEKKGTIYMYP